MCGPLAPVLGLAFGVMGQFAQYNAEKQQAAMTEAAYQQNKSNAHTALRSDYSQNNLRAIQEGEKKSAEDQKARIQQAKLKAKSRLSAGEAGITGISVSNLTADIATQASTEAASREYNYISTINQLQEEGKSAQARAQSRIDSAPRGVKPSKLGLIAGIGSSFMGNFGGAL